MGSKAENIHKRHSLWGSGGRGWWSEGHGPAHSLWEKKNLTLISLKCHSLILRPVLCKSVIVIFRQQFESFDSNNFTLSSMFSLKKYCVAHKKKCCIDFNTFYMYFFLVRIRLDHNFLF